MAYNSYYRTCVPITVCWCWGRSFAFIGASASAFSPTLLGWGNDALTAEVTAQKLALYSLGLVALSATLAIFRYQLRMLTGEIAAGVTYQMSQDLFHRLLLFDMETRQQYGTGDLLLHATSDFIYIWRFYSGECRFTRSFVVDWLRADGCNQPTAGGDRRGHVDDQRDCPGSLGVDS